MVAVRLVALRRHLLLLDDRDGDDRHRLAVLLVLHDREREAGSRDHVVIEFLGDPLPADEDIGVAGNRQKAEALLCVEELELPDSAFADREDRQWRFFDRFLGRGSVFRRIVLRRMLHHERQVVPRVVERHERLLLIGPVDEGARRRPHGRAAFFHVSGLLVQRSAEQGARAVFAATHFGPRDAILGHVKLPFLVCHSL